MYVDFHSTDCEKWGTLHDIEVKCSCPCHAESRIILSDAVAGTRMLLDQMRKMETPDVLSVENVLSMAEDVEASLARLLAEVAPIVKVNG